MYNFLASLTFLAFIVSLSHFRGAISEKNSYGGFFHRQKGVTHWKFILIQWFLVHRLLFCFTTLNDWLKKLDHATFSTLNQMHNQSLLSLLRRRSLGSSRNLSSPHERVRVRGEGVRDERKECLRRRLIAVWSHAIFHAWRHVMSALSFHWFIVLSTFVVIGHCNWFGTRDTQ